MLSSGSDFLKLLSPEQLAAATYPPTASLQILAGPGSGKTRTLTSRVAWLVIDQELPPETCVVVTFTNKAAKEMRERLNVLIGGEYTSRLVLGTFHSVCVRLLRQHGRQIDLASDFLIADVEECKKRLKTIIQDGSFPIKVDEALNIISQTKCKNLTVSEYKADPLSSELIGKIYELHQKALEEESSLDFDDILMYAARLFATAPHTVSRYRHVLVDEFQDTSVLQLKIMTLLAASCRCVTVVGDADQSIYGWRAAEVENLKRMRDEFEGTKQVFLEENFRSTSTIVETALRVVQQEPGRIAKGLRTTHPNGPPVVLRAAPDADQEAIFIATEIKRLIAYSGGMLSFKDFVILLRYNALSRPIEAQLQAQGIPNRILGGSRFFDRKEVRDVMAYITLIAVPRNTAAFERVANVPKRGIGERSLRDFMDMAKERGIGPMVLAEQLLDMNHSAGIKCRTEAVARGLRQFAKVIRQGRRHLEEGMTLTDLLSFVLEQFEYLSHLRKEPGWEARWENIKELKNYASTMDLADSSVSTTGATPSDVDLLEVYAHGRNDAVSQTENSVEILNGTRGRKRGMQTFEETALPVKRTKNADALPDSFPPSGSLSETEDVNSDFEDALFETQDTAVASIAGELTPIQRFLEASTLDTHQNEVDGDGPSEYVTISTCHSAKGLEWPAVFVAGVEDGKFPFFRSTTEPEINEERRLLYVAITRAQTNLYLTRTLSSMHNGRSVKNPLSRFLVDLAPQVLGGVIKDPAREAKVPRLALVGGRPNFNDNVSSDMSAVLERPLPSAKVVQQLTQEFTSSTTCQALRDNDIACAKGIHDNRSNAGGGGSSKWSQNRFGAPATNPYRSSSSQQSRQPPPPSKGFMTARALSQPEGSANAQPRILGLGKTTTSSGASITKPFGPPRIVKAAPSFTNDVRLYGTANGAGGSQSASLQTPSGGGSSGTNLDKFQSTSKSSISNLLDMLPP